MGKLEQSLAKQVVRKSLALREGEEYVIDTWQHTIPLAEALMVEAAKVGAHPHVLLTTDEAYRRYLSEVPEEYMRKTSDLSLHIHDAFITATTDLGGPEDPAIFEKMPAERMSAMQEGIKPLMDKSLERKIRGVFIGMGQVTPERAAKYGLDYDAWSRSVQDALGTDLSEIAKAGSSLVSLLEGGRQVHVTAKNGTDLAFEVEGRKAYLEDGIVDAEDIKKGAFYATLPAGTVSIAPRETTANGTVVFDQMALWGRVLTNVWWTFQDGQLREYAVDKNRDTWENFYGPAKGDKDRIGAFTIGLNPRGQPLGMSLTDWFYAGIVSVGIGSNEFLGGSNDTAFEWSASVPGATVEVDGKEIVSGGKLV